MHLHRVLSAALVVAVSAFGACAHQGTATVAPAASSDSLAALVHSRFAVAPIHLELRSQRALIGFSRAPWADSSEAVQFDRAYDVARLTDRYARSRVATPSVCARPLRRRAPRSISSTQSNLPRESARDSAPRASSPRWRLQQTGDLGRWAANGRSPCYARLRFLYSLAQSSLAPLP
jgi:hypothetical protein